MILTPTEMVDSIRNRHFIKLSWCSCGWTTQVFTEGIAICPKAIEEFTKAIIDSVNIERGMCANVSERFFCSAWKSAGYSENKKTRPIICGAIAKAIRERWGREELQPTKVYCVPAYLHLY